MVKRICYLCDNEIDQPEEDRPEDCDFFHNERCPDYQMNCKLRSRDCPPPKGNEEIVKKFDEINKKVDERDSTIELLHKSNLEFKILLSQQRPNNIKEIRKKEAERDSFAKLVKKQIAETEILIKALKKEMLNQKG